MLRVGLTGGIACGKSHVLRRLAGHGLDTLDLDAVARDVTAPGRPALDEIASAFGAGVLRPDGSLDRPALAAMVFTDAGARARLNAIVHPRVRAEEARRARDLSGRGKAALVTDAALLVESGAHLRFDRLVVVHCDPGQQLRRLRARDGLDERAAAARIESQMPLAEKRAFAHFEVDTSGSVDESDRAADALAGELLALAGAGRDPRAVAPGTLLGGLVHGPGVGPRGLDPAGLLAGAAEAGGLEMEELGRRLTPVAAGPWYAAAAEAEPGAAAAYLAVAVAAWALCRERADAPFLAAAAGSIARLTHTDAAARADACVVATVAQEVALAGGAPGDVVGLAGRMEPLASRFGGAPPTGGLVPVWAAVRAHPRDPTAARAECARRGGDPALAGALAGLGAPFDDSPGAGALLAVLAAIRSATPWPARRGR
jgi:dephospho-CoA kinase